jgi:hypothetical protein
MMASLQLSNAEFLWNLLNAMRGKEEFLFIRIARTEVLRLIVGRCFVRVEKFESHVAAF